MGSEEWNGDKCGKLWGSQWKTRGKKRVTVKKEKDGYEKAIDMYLGKMNLRELVEEEIWVPGRDENNGGQSGDVKMQWWYCSNCRGS